MSKSQAGFQQAGIAVQDVQKFGELRAAMERVFSPERVTRLFRKLESKQVSARDFEEVLQRGVLESVDGNLAQAGSSALAMYEALPASDQGQVREFYLTAVESVDESLREKYSKLYGYY